MTTERVATIYLICADMATETANSGEAKESDIRYTLGLLWSRGWLVHFDPVVKVL